MNVTIKDLILVVMGLALIGETITLINVSTFQRWQRDQCVTRQEADRVTGLSERIVTINEMCVRVHVRAGNEQSMLVAEK